MPIRTSPDIPDDIPRPTKKQEKELAALLEQASLFTTYGGEAWGHTKDRELAEKLAAGVEVGKTAENVPIFVRCGSSRQFQMAKDGPTFYEFRIPVMLLELTRAILDKRASVAA